MKTNLLTLKGKRERGYTLLEYCAGAAVVLAVIWGALNTMGGNITQLLDQIGQWALDRKDSIQVDDGG